MEFIKHKKKEQKPFVSAVIVAAGKSERLGLSRSKQLIPLCGISVIARTISVFEDCGEVSEIVIVTNRFDIVKIAGLIKEFGFDKVSRVVIGGDSRQKSVAAGFEAINKKAEFVAIHDGARPLVTVACIERTIENAALYGAAAAAVKVKDTVKFADENGVVISTPDRQLMWAVQTPQTFRVKLYREALKAAEASGEDYTDDCQLVEAVGGKIQLTKGEYNNIKITTVEDIAQAETLIRARGDAF